MGQVGGGGGGGGGCYSELIRGMKKLEIRPLNSNLRILEGVRLSKLELTMKES